MSEIPMQSPLSRGAHEADEFADGMFDGDASSYDETDAYASPGGTVEFEPVPSAVDLDSDPFADDLSKELAHAAPKTWFNRTTIVIGGLVLIVGGFLGGIQVQKHYGSSSTNSAATDIANLRNQFARTGTGNGTTRGEGNFPGFGGTNGATGAAAAGQTGTIKFVDGTTIYVTLADGTVLTVQTTGSTKVVTSTTTKLSALKVGETITVGGGTPDSSGNMTATTVTATK